MSKYVANYIVHSVVIIDSDSATAAQTEKILRELGVFQIEICKNGQQGLDAIRSGSFVAAIIDWGLKGTIPCYAILSRLRRSQSSLYFPIVIAAGMTKKEDLKMIEDFSCVKIVDKPVRRTSIDESLRAVYAEKRWFVSNERRMSDVMNAVTKDPRAAVSSMSRILATSPNPGPIALIASRHLINQHSLIHAEAIYDDLLRKDPRNLQALNAKAKLLSKMGRKKEALAVLMRAFDISPKNIDRLGLMGDLEISLKHPQQAIDYFQSALGLDGQDLKSKIGMKVAQSYGVIVDLQISGSRDEPSVARLINNLGVHLSKNGQIERALKYYLTSFAFLDNQDVQSKVSFNLGLGYKKWNKLPQAKYWFERALGLAKGSYSKAERHLVEMTNIVSLEVMTEAGKNLEVSSKIILPVPIIHRANLALDSDLFEEETMYGEKDARPSPLLNASLEKIISDIDAEVDDGLFKFDEAI
ncbi:MAG: hypothetical protein NTV34_07315 [Proteobacteria bacterium]|nr:hypothetical protein [Pseudomonadota bacterium]